NAGGGKIARPFDSGDKFAQDVLMRGEHGITSLAGRGRDQKMCRALERLFRQWLVASKDECLYPRRAEICHLFLCPAGACNAAALRCKAAGEDARAIAAPETEEPLARFHLVSSLFTRTGACKK